MLLLYNASISRGMRLICGWKEMLFWRIHAKLRDYLENRWACFADKMRTFSTHLRIHVFWYQFANSLLVIHSYFEKCYLAGLESEMRLMAIIIPILHKTISNLSQNSLISFTLFSKYSQISRLDATGLQIVSKKFKFFQNVFANVHYSPFTNLKSADTIIYQKNRQIVSERWQVNLLL